MIGSHFGQLTIISIIAVGEYKIAHWTPMSKAIHEEVYKLCAEGGKVVGNLLSFSFCCLLRFFFVLVVYQLHRGQENNAPSKETGKDSTRSSCLSLSLSLSLSLRLSILFIIHPSDTIVQQRLDALNSLKRKEEEWPPTCLSVISYLTRPLIIRLVQLWAMII